MQKLYVRKVDGIYTIRMYGTDYELILPEDKDVPKKKKTSRKTTSKVASKTTKKTKEETK